MARLAAAVALLTLASGRTASAAPLSGEELNAALRASISERLGVEAVIETLAGWPPLNLDAQQARICVRYPAHKASSLPEALEIRVGQRLEACLPLVRYLSFTLPVVVAPDGLALHSRITAEQLALESRTLGAGSECCCDPSGLAGLESRVALPAGALVLPSRLRAPADVRRGDSVTLILRMDGMEVRAEASALADAYIGQRISVRRVSDRRQFSGVLQSGPIVEVE